MCQDCGCGDTNLVSVDVHEKLLEGNDRIAHHNRAHFRERGVTAINVMGSPGAGKTALLEATARRLGATRRLAAIAGDLETERDAERLRRAGIPAAAITTGSACHLDAEMVHDSLHEFPRGAVPAPLPAKSAVFAEPHPQVGSLHSPGAFGAGHDHGHHDHDQAHGHHHDHERGVADVDYLFIENVGNLVCPAIYDLGQHKNVVLLSVTEGEDKPLKYPVMFRRADVVLLTKIDLLPALPELDLAALDAAIRHVMPEPRVIAVSARTGAGIDPWIGWIESVRLEVHGTARPTALEACHV